MKRQRIKTTLKLALGMVALVAAYQAGIMSGSLLLSRFTSEADLRRAQLLSAREAELRRFFARAAIRSALLKARFAQLVARQAQLTGEAPRSDELPPDRLRALRDRLDEDAQQHQRRLLRLKAEQRGGRPPGSGT